MRRGDVGVFNILRIKWTKLPVRFLLPLRIFKFRHLTEDSDLLDEVLQGFCMNGKAGFASRFFRTGGLVLLKFLRPIDDNFLELGTG